MGYPEDAAVKDVSYLWHRMRDSWEDAWKWWQKPTCAICGGLSPATTATRGRGGSFSFSCAFHILHISLAVTDLEHYWQAILENEIL